MTSRFALRKAGKVPQDIYRGYMPPDLPQHRPPNRIKPWWKVLGKPRLTVYPRPEVEEYSEVPEYPPINDASKKGLKRQIRLDWYESLKALPTAEQKLYEIGRHTTHKAAHIYNWLPTANSLPFAQYLTQTNLIKSLPPSYELTSRASQDQEQGDGIQSAETSNQSDMNSRIKQMVLEQIVLDRFETEKNKRTPFISKSSRDGNMKAYVSNTMIQNIFNNVKKALVCETNPQLMEYQIDNSPAIKSWWYHSGFEPCDNRVFHRSRKDEEGHVNTIIQMEGSSALNVRSKHLMEPILALDDPLVTDISMVAENNFTPRYHGAAYKFRNPTALPGFWFEETPLYDCPHTCFLSTDCLQLRQRKRCNYANQLVDMEDCLNGQAILTAFGWLNSLSMYHGYTPYQEIDYPLTCQVVTTNGQDWLFNIYQFNAHTFHRDLGGPKRNNVCWSSGLMKLYDIYESGSFKGVNDDVIKMLTKFLSSQTSAKYTDQLNLRPLLGEDTRTQEEKDETSKKLRVLFEQKMNRWLLTQWKVPEYEHIFFRAKETRFQIKHMKARWHIPKPQYPKIFE